MAYVLTFEGEPNVPFMAWYNNDIIDREYLEITCTTPLSNTRTVELKCTGRWGAKCFEEFAEKNKPMRKWSCFIGDAEVRSSVNAAFDSLDESKAYVEWEEFGSNVCGYLRVSPERDKDECAACVVVFKAVGFNE